MANEDTSQDYFDSQTWGRLTFFPAKNATWNDCCKHCLLDRTPGECKKALCIPSQRKDKRNGYYAIHEMPNEKVTTN